MLLIPTFGQTNTLKSAFLCKSRMLRKKKTELYSRQKDYIQLCLILDFLTLERILLLSVQQC